MPLKKVIRRGIVFWEAERSSAKPLPPLPDPKGDKFHSEESLARMRAMAAQGKFGFVFPAGAKRGKAAHQ